MNKKLEIKEDKDEIWINCPHEKYESHSIPLSNNPDVFFLCCCDCYERFLGHFILEILKPINKLANKL